MTKKQRIATQSSAVLIGTYSTEISKSQASEFIDELAFLATTAHIVVGKIFLQQLRNINPKYFIGTGKLQEIKEFIDSHSIDIVIFDDELTPAQQKNIGKFLEIDVIDRTFLILDIFAKRAKTATAKTQVELAQYQYLLTRLTGFWTHLERQKGGIGFRGPGEKELETDRRIIRDKITRLKKELAKIEKVKTVQRKGRGQIIRVALVGYTNVGKSTLMNLLSNEKVFAENKLFATLDTTVRKIVIHNLPFLLSDTVGFIRKLPTMLVESFKSTLDEVREADYLIHVVDVSHPQYPEQIDVVNQTLIDIGTTNKPTLLLFNKIDKIVEINAPDFSEKLRLIEKNPLLQQKNKTIAISAKKQIGIDKLKSTLYQEIKKIHLKRFPHKLLY
ncbi:MAG: GTPase HflX [Bacteroidales bacterium]|nr:GTPase HflX [Bacteroidales bacterium]